MINNSSAPFGAPEVLNPKGHAADPASSPGLEHRGCDTKIFWKFLEATQNLRDFSSAQKLDKRTSTNPAGRKLSGSCRQALQIVLKSCRAVNSNCVNLGRCIEDFWSEGAWPRIWSVRVDHKTAICSHENQSCAQESILLGRVGRRRVRTLCSKWQAATSRVRTLFPK